MVKWGCFLMFSVNNCNQYIINHFLKQKIMNRLFISRSTSTFFLALILANSCSQSSKAVEWPNVGVYGVCIVGIGGTIVGVTALVYRGMAQIITERTQEHYALLARDQYNAQQDEAKRKRDADAVFIAQDIRYWPLKFTELVKPEELLKSFAHAGDYRHYEACKQLDHDIDEGRQALANLDGAAREDKSKWLIRLTTVSDDFKAHYGAKIFAEERAYNESEEEKKVRSASLRQFKAEAALKEEEVRLKTSEIELEKAKTRVENERRDLLQMQQNNERAESQERRNVLSAMEDWHRRSGSVQIYQHLRKIEDNGRELKSEVSSIKSELQSGVSLVKNKLDTVGIDVNNTHLAVNGLTNRLLVRQNPHDMNDLSVVEQMRATWLLVKQIIQASAPVEDNGYVHELPERGQK